jgi:hypothetical protein
MANLRPRGADPIAIIETLSDISEGLGNWIAGPVPDNDIAAAIQQRYRDQCDAYSNAPGWMKAFNTPSRVTMTNICDPWLTSQGSGPPVEGTPEVTGGQCEGIEYRAGAPNVTTPSVSRGIGPLSVSTSFGESNGRPTFSISFSWAGGLTGGVGVTTTFDDGPSPTISERYTGVVASRVDDQPDLCGDSPLEPAPNPNPRPDPGLGPDEEPFEDPDGRPIIPMPGIENPWGAPIQLPNFPLPDLFGEESGGGSNPNVGPPVNPGSEQTGDGVNGEDDDFPEPPEGSIYVGFIVKMSDQGVSEGLQVNSPPEPIYRATTGNYRAIYEVDGVKVYSTPKRIQSETSVYWLDLPGLTLVGARVNVPSNDSYSVTPLYQAETDSEPQEV